MASEWNSLFSVDFRRTVFVVVVVVLPSPNPIFSAFNFMVWEKGHWEWMVFFRQRELPHGKQEQELALKDITCGDDYGDSKQKRRIPIWLESLAEVVKSSAV